MLMSRRICCCVAGPPLFNCGTCSIPKANMTVNYSNGFIGDGTATLVFNGLSNWQSVCTHQLLYQLLCNAGQIEFRVIYFISGACPSGTSQYCSTIGNNPLKLQRDSLVCGNRFKMVVSLTNAQCPNLFGNGYTDFTIKYP